MFNFRAEKSHIESRKAVLIETVAPKLPAFEALDLTVEAWIVGSHGCVGKERDVTWRWLNQPIWNICASQIGSKLPR